MKFRPQMQLRFRDEEQFAAIQKLAREKAISVNEYVLLALEANQDPTRKADVPMGIHATPGACDRGDADTDSITGCQVESGETGDRIAGGGQSNKRSKNPKASHGGKPSGKKSDPTKTIDGHPGAEVAVCKRCMGTVRRDPKNEKYWRCHECKRQLDNSEVA